MIKFNYNKAKNTVLRSVVMKKIFKLILQLVLIISLSSCAATINFNEAEENTYSFYTGESLRPFDTLESGYLDLEYTDINYLEEEDEKNGAQALVELIEGNTVGPCSESDFEEDSFFPVILKETASINTFFIFNFTTLLKKADTKYDSKTRYEQEKPQDYQKVTTNKTIIINGREMNFELMCKIEAEKVPVTEEKSWAKFKDPKIQKELPEFEDSYFEKRKKGITRFKIDAGGRWYKLGLVNNNIYSYVPSSMPGDNLSKLPECSEIKIDSQRIEIIYYTGRTSIIYVSNGSKTSSSVCKKDFSKVTKGFATGIPFYLGDKEYQVIETSSNLIQIEEIVDTNEVYIIQGASIPSDLIDYFTRFHNEDTQTVIFKSYDYSHLPTIAQGIDVLQEEDLCSNKGATDLVPIAIDKNLGVTFFRATSPYDITLCYEFSPRYLQNELATYEEELKTDGLELTISKVTKP
jgi:hypothetical protein